MATIDKIKLSGSTYDIVDSSAIHSMDGYWTSGQTESAITAATGALAETIAEQHYQTSGDVQNAISGKANSSDVVTAVEINNNSESIGINVTSGGTTTRKQLFLLGRGLTMADESNGEIQIDSDNIPTKSWVNSSISGFADAVAYDTTTKYMKFYNGGTGGTMVYQFDASPFLIDGMVQNVEIKDVTISGESVTCLVISFNTDAGRQDINIPLTAIFDPSNYVDMATYTAYTAATDTVLGNKADTTAMTQAISEATSGKVDNSTYTAYTAATDATLSGKVDNSTYTAYTAATDTALAGKQETLVNQVNIKSINGSSILGSGDLTVDTGLHAEVSGTTLVFS